MEKSLKVKIKGVAPFISHSGEMANPMNPYSLKMKEFTSKRKKTESDYLKMSEIEWYGGLYIGNKNDIIIPPHVLQAMVDKAGKSIRLTDKFKQGVYITDPAKFSHKGPKDIKKLWEDEKFRYVRLVNVKNGSSKVKVLRTRPIFNEWEAEFEIKYLDSVVDRSDLERAMTHAKDACGLGDERPRFGRFEIVSMV